MEPNYLTDLTWNKYFCPKCFCATFFQHRLPENRDWHHCSHCGFMQLTKEHYARINKVINDHYGVKSNDDSQQKDKEE